MLANLFTEARLANIESAIEANRTEAASLVSIRTPEAGKRMNQLNEAWVKLVAAKQQVTGIDPAPYVFRG